MVIITFYLSSLFSAHPSSHPSSFIYLFTISPCILSVFCLYSLCTVFNLSVFSPPPFFLPGAHQMKLPDDKDPQIVWDAEKKRWIDKSKPEGEEDNVPPPPPAMMKKPAAPAPTPDATSSAAPSAAPSGGVAAAAPPPMGSSFRMNRSRGGARSRYVDVMKDSGSVSASPAPPSVGAAGGMMTPMAPPAPISAPPGAGAPAPVGSTEGDAGEPPMMFFNPSTMGGAVANPFQLPPAK